MVEAFAEPFVDGCQLPYCVRVRILVGCCLKTQLFRLFRAVLLAWLGFWHWQSEVIAYFMLGIEIVAKNIEEPFGADEDDLNLEGI